MYFVYSGKHSWTVNMTYRMIGFTFLWHVNDWITLLVIHSSLIISKSEIHHFNSFWSGFPFQWMIFTHVRQIQLFFKSSRSFPLLTVYFYFKGMFQANIDTMTYFHLNLLMKKKNPANLVFIHCIENELGLCLSSKNAIPP